jgi:hypothetical protein
MGDANGGWRVADCALAPSTGGYLVDGGVEDRLMQTGGGRELRADDNQRDMVPDGSNNHMLQDDNTIRVVLAMNDYFKMVEDDPSFPDQFDTRVYTSDKTVVLEKNERRHPHRNDYSFLNVEDEYNRCLSDSKELSPNVQNPVTQAISHCTSRVTSEFINHTKHDNNCSCVECIREIEIELQCNLDEWEPSDDEMPTTCSSSLGVIPPEIYNGATPNNPFTASFRASVSPGAQDSNSFSIDEISAIEKHTRHGPNTRGAFYHNPFTIEEFKSMGIHGVDIDPRDLNEMDDLEDLPGLCSYPITSYRREEIKDPHFADEYGNRIFSADGWVVMWRDAEEVPPQYNDPNCGSDDEPLDIMDFDISGHRVEETPNLHTMGIPGSPSRATFSLETSSRNTSALPSASDVTFFTTGSLQTGVEEEESKGEQDRIRRARRAKQQRVRRAKVLGLASGSGLV